MKGPHKRKPRSIGKRTSLNACEIRQVMGYLRTLERDYPGLRDDAVTWGRHIRVKEFLNRLYLKETNSHEQA